MWGTLILGVIVGTAAYVATGGTNYALGLLIAIAGTFIGIGVAAWLEARH